MRQTFIKALLKNIIETYNHTYIYQGGLLFLYIFIYFLE